MRGAAQRRYRKKSEGDRARVDILLTRVVVKVFQQI